MSDEDEFLDQLRELFARRDRETKQAELIYNTLLSKGDLHSRRRNVQCLSYRCAEHGCGLLDVITTPSGVVIVGFPRYKTSPEWTVESSSEDGRTANTEDGDRHWRCHAGPMSAVSNPTLNCDHLRSVLLLDADLQRDLAAGHAEVRVRRDGSRYAVT